MNESKYKSTEPGSQTVSQNSLSKLWKQRAHPLSAPLIKKKKKAQNAEWAELEPA